MVENNIIVRNIRDVRRDTLIFGEPYIPAIPRYFSSLAYVTDGQFRYTCRNASHIVRKGELLFIRGGDIDVTESFECRSVSYIFSDFMIFDNDFSFPTRITVSPPVGAQIESLYAEMLKIWRSGRQNALSSSIQSSRCCPTRYSRKAATATGIRKLPLSWNT